MWWKIKATVERQFCDGSGGVNEELDDTKRVIRIRNRRRTDYTMAKKWIT